jgi:DNA-binding GntR family transcriptional regulator
MTDAADSSTALASPRLARKRIERGNLHDEVVAVLRDMIIEDELPPGAHIPEAELCRQLGISRTPLREAIRVLVSEGLVTPLPRRGAVVATPTREEIQGLLYAQGAIESMCAPLASANWTDTEIAAIGRQHKAMLGHHARGQLKEYYRANQAIHRAIVQGARNGFLGELYDGLSLRVLRARYFIEMPKASWSRALREHEQILALIQKRDGKKLADLMLLHMNGSWQDFELSFSRPRLARSV